MASLTETTCPVCFEENDVEAAKRPNVPHVFLKLCSHEVCLECLRVWFKTCEENGRSEPSCPKCRKCVHEDDILRVLGRSFIDRSVQRKNKNLVSQSGQSGIEIDEPTMAWLERNGAKECGNCGIWIERSDGCNAMMCLCGYKFCLTCGEGIDSCRCGVRHDDYFDNVLGELESEVWFSDGDLEYDPVVASPEDLENLRDYLENRRKMREAFRKQYSDGNNGLICSRDIFNTT